MADIGGKIAAARKAGYSDDDIVKFLSNDPQYGAGFKTAQTHGYSSADILGHFTPVADEPAPVDPANLKANDTLGFYTGGLRPVNNLLKWGSGAAQAAGADPKAVHAVGKVIRNVVSLGQGVQNQDQISNLERAAAAQGQRPGRLGQAVGSTAMAVPLAVASAPLAPEAGSAALARLGYVAGEGAVNGAVNTEHPEDAGAVAGDAALGAGANLAGLGLNRAIGATVAPRFSASMNKLLELGQRKFSPAQLTGSKALQKLEDAGRSTVAFGALAEGAQNNAQKDFNRALLQQASDTANLGVKVEKPTHSTFDTLSNAFDTNYKNLYGQVQVGTSPALQASKNLGAVRGALPDELAAKVEALQKPVYDPNTQQWQHGTLSGSDVLEIDQTLRDQAKALLNPGAGPVPVANYAKAKALIAARDELTGALKDQQPQLADQIAANRKGYAMFKRTQEAAADPVRGVDPGQFSAEKFRSKVYAAAGRNQKATLGSAGRIPGQDVADAAVEVMGSRVPDSGTAFRTALGKVLGGSAEAGGGAAILHSPAVIPAAALYATYLPGIRDALSAVATAPRNALLKKARELGAGRVANKLSRVAATPAVEQATNNNDALRQRLNQEQ